MNKDRKKAEIYELRRIDLKNWSVQSKSYRRYVWIPCATAKGFGWSVCRATDTGCSNRCRWQPGSPSWGSFTHIGKPVKWWTSYAWKHRRSFKNISIICQKNSPKCLQQCRALQGVLFIVSGFNRKPIIYSADSSFRFTVGFAQFIQRSATVSIVAASRIK